jgi:4-hydroxy-3-methylbut-2-en-1-yl diphosphate reductase
MAEPTAVATPVLVTALRIERAAVRSGAQGARVVRSGMGTRRAARLASRLTGNGPVAVLGVAGGLAAEVRPGDVVVASEVRGDGEPVRCAAAPLVAGALRRAGLTVHLGPIVTSSTFTGTGAGRALAATGALAVDMETAPIAAACADRPFVAVRTIVDTHDLPLLRIGTLRRGVQALRALRRAAPVVASWADAATATDREVMLASPRSFCAGVERAIDIVRRAIDRFGAPVYVRRQVVHNRHVVDELTSLGAVFVTELDEVPEGSRVVLAAHGVAPEVRISAAERGLAVVDATCPLVAKVHQEVRRYVARDQTVILIGHSDHEEVVGTVGEAPGRVLVVADATEAERVEVDDPTKIAYVMQTTLAVDDAEDAAAVLRRRFPELTMPAHEDICYATSNRQQALREIAGECDLVLVVGSVNSSNSQRLVEVARRTGAQAYLVDDASGVELGWLASTRRVGVTAGASAPPRLVDELVAALAATGAATVREHRAVEEAVRFALPKEVS